MKKFSEQLHKRSQTVKLKAAERRELRERVVSYMEYHPLPGAAAKKVAATPSPYFTERFVSIPFSYFARAGAAVAVLMLVVIPALAERAVPGDGLYAIKVRFNEEVRGTLALTPYQRIEWETELLNRRIAEARLLANEGRLTEDVEAEVAAAVRTHTENAKRGIEELRSEDEEEATLATIELSTTLEVQAASLDDDEDTEAEGQTRLLATVVKEAAGDDSVTALGVPGYDRLMARVETNTTRVQELVSSLDFESEAADRDDVNRRIDDIDRTVGEAIATRENDEGAARLLLVDALQRTQKLIVFLTEIQTSQEFEVEDFVPVVLTPEEEITQTAEFRASAAATIGGIEAQLSSSTDPDLLEKTNALLESAREQRVIIDTTEVFAEVEAAHTALDAIAGDITRLLDVPTNRPATTSEPIDSSAEDVSVEGEATTTVETEEGDAIEVVEEVSESLETPVL